MLAIRSTCDASSASQTSGAARRELSDGSPHWTISSTSSSANVLKVQPQLGYRHDDDR